MIPAFAEVAECPDRAGRHEEVVRAHVAESGGQDADDACRLVVEDERSTHGVAAAAERALPELRAHDRNGGRAGSVVVGNEVAAEDRRDAERVEEVCRHVTSGEPFRARASGPDEDVVARGGKRFECALPRAPVDEVRPGHRHHVAVPVDFLHEHDPLGIGKRQRPQHDAVDHREDRRRGADAECQGRDDGERESGCFRVGADGVLQVVEDRFEHGGLLLE